jgi:O-antigen/teichoic acid export membrane protein
VIQTSYKKFTQDVGLIGITQLLLRLGGLILIPIITKTLGAYQYGIWAQILVTISLLTPLVMLGLSATIVRFLSGEKDKEKIREGFLSVAAVILFTGSLLSVILFWSSDFLASAVFSDINASYFVKAASFLVLITALDEITLSYFRTFQQIKTFSAFTLLKTFGELGLIAYLLLSGFGLFGAIIALLIVDGIIFVIAFSFAISQIGFKLPDFSELKTYLRYGLPLTPNAAIAWIINSSDRYIIGYFIGMASVGVYSVAYAMGNLITFFLTPIMVILFPTISKLYEEKSIEEVRNYLKYSLKYFLIFAIPSAFGLSVLAKPSLRILTTSEFVSGSIVVPFVAFGVITFGIFQICIYITHLVKKTKLNVMLLGTSATLNIMLNIILIPYIGILGAAIATFISYGVLALLTVFVSFKYLKFDIDWYFILKSTISSIAMAFVISKVNPIGLFQVLTSIGIGAVAYFVLIVLLKGVTKTELKFFYDIGKGFVGISK